MVGPEHEKAALIRHSSRLFLSAAALDIPMITILVRKGYGLGAMAMAGGSFHTSYLTLAWPSAEIGGMGLEGAIKLGYKKELEAIDDLKMREQRYHELVAIAYEKGKAINAAETLEFDEVIDPVDTRKRILSALSCFSPKITATRYIDSW